MEVKTYQYLNGPGICMGMGIHLSPCLTTGDPAVQKEIEENHLFKNGGIVSLELGFPKDYPKPEIDVEVQMSRRTLFEGERISTLKLPRLRAAAKVIGYSDEEIDALKRPALIKAIMVRTVK